MEHEVDAIYRGNRHENTCSGRISAFATPSRINPNLTISTYVSPGPENLISWLRGVLKFKKPVSGPLGARIARSNLLRNSEISG